MTIKYYSNHICKCGHSARAHGPTKPDEEFHKRCMHCLCPEFDKLEWYQDELPGVENGQREGTDKLRSRDKDIMGEEMG